jgi:hypothetical protein
VRRILLVIASLLLVKAASAEFIWQSTQAVDTAHRTYQYKFYTEKSGICPSWSKAIFAREGAESEICWRDNGSLIEIKRAWGAGANSDYLLKPEGLGSADLSTENLASLKGADGKSEGLVQRPAKTSDELTPTCSLLNARPANDARNRISFGDQVETQCSQERADLELKLVQSCNLRIMTKYDHFKYDDSSRADIGEQVSDFKIIGNTRQEGLNQRITDVLATLNLKGEEFGVLGSVLDTKTKAGKFNSVIIENITRKNFICVVGSGYDFVELAEF